MSLKSKIFIIILLSGMFLCMPDLFFPQKSLYNQSVKFCDKKPLRGKSEISYCQYSYIKSKNPKKAKEYLKIRNYCYKKTHTTVDTDVCVENILKH